MTHPDAPHNSSQYERLIGTEAWQSVPLHLFGKEYPRWTSPILTPAQMREEISVLKPEAFIVSFDFHGTIERAGTDTLSQESKQGLERVRARIEDRYRKPAHVLINTSTDFTQFRIHSIAVPMIYSTGFGLMEQRSNTYVNPRKNESMSAVSKKLNKFLPIVSLHHYTYIDIHSIPTRVARHPAAITSYFESLLNQADASDVCFYWGSQGLQIKIHPDTTKEEGIAYFAQRNGMTPEKTWVLHIGDKKTDIPRKDPGFLRYLTMTFGNSPQSVKNHVSHILEKNGIGPIETVVNDIFS